MLREVVLLWLAAEPAAREAERALDAWAAQKGIALARPAPAALASEYDAGLVEEVERSLEDARKAIGGRDSEAGAILTRIDQLLLAHPELPQAAWLAAERQHLELEWLEQSRASAERLSVARARAHALEGSRAVAFDGAGPGATAPPNSARATLRGVRKQDQVWINGVPAEQQGVAAGVHHVRVERGGLVAQAAWLAIAEDLQLVVDDPTAACSALDLAGTRADKGHPVPAPGVACAEWLVARPSANGGVDLAWCRNSTCQSWSRYQAGPAGLSIAAGPADSRGGVSWARSDWLTWGLVGGAVVLTSGIVLWQAGAFNSSERPPEFVFTGPAASALTF